MLPKKIGKMFPQLTDFYPIFEQKLKFIQRIECDKDVSMIVERIASRLIVQVIDSRVYHLLYVFLLCLRNRCKRSLSTECKESQKYLKAEAVRSCAAL